jgi:predicted dinucleotide-binding enzyme
VNQSNTATRRRAGLIGAGNVGTAIATRLVQLGWEVDVANSRGPQTLQDFARQTGARAVTIDEIGSGAELLVLAVPLVSIPELQRVIQHLPPHAVVVDTGNYVPPRDGVIPEIVDGLPETAWVAQRLGVPVVKAFNNIIAGSLATTGTTVGTVGRVALPVSGDDPRGRTVVMRLVEDLGFTPHDSGALDESWRQQPGQPAYCTNPTIAELPALLERADQAEGPGRRDQALKVALKLPATFPAAVLTRASRFSVGLDRWKLAAWIATARVGLALLRP